MLHRLNPVDRRCEDELYNLIDLQRKVLRYASNNSSFQSNTFRNEMGNDFVDWFEASQQSGMKDQQKAFNNFEQNLNALAKCSNVDKQRVYDDFELDQDFYLSLNDPSFIFAFSPKISPAHDKAKVCLNSFYTFLNWSYPSSITVSGSDFHRQDIVQSYLDANPVLESVCPCCDNSWPEPVRGNGSPYTLEHFFHKDEHPSICLHPYNLIPMCSICNGRRGDEEILSPTDMADITIDKIFHPIERPAREYAELEFRSRRLEPETMNFVNSPRRVDDWKDAIDAYRNVYRIPDRWGDKWNDIQSTANNAIYFALQAWILSGVEITRPQFVQALAEVEDKFMQGYGRYQYPAGRWIAWARRNYLDLLYQTHVKSRQA